MYVYIYSDILVRSDSTKDEGNKTKFIGGVNCREFGKINCRYRYIKLQ
jgi:hypothetical protein